MKESINKSKLWKQLVGVSCSALIYSFAINCFASKGKLYPAGLSGITRLIVEVCKLYLNVEVSFGVVFFLLNFIISILAFKYIGKKLALLSILWFALTSVFTLKPFPYVMVEDLTLLAIFGGVINGFAVGLALRNKASSGGLDFLSIYLSMVFNKPCWGYIFAINLVILAFAGCLFGWTFSFYSIIYQFVSMAVIDRMYDNYKLTSLFVVTDKSEEVVSAIYYCCRHGITKINVEGCYTHKNKTMLFITLNQCQVNDVMKAIKKIDMQSFVSMFESKEVVGNFYQTPVE